MSLSLSTTLSRGRLIRRFSGGLLEKLRWRNGHFPVRARIPRHHCKCERRLYERSGPGERGNGRAVLCIVRKSPGLHTAIAETRQEREAILLSPKAGPAAIAPDHSRAFERSAHRRPLRPESDNAALQVGGN